MNCQRCGSWCAPSDNYCRNCGDKLQMVLPPAHQSRALTGLPAALPPAVVKGVALAVAGKAVEWAMRRAARKLAGSAGDILARRLVSRSPAARVIPPTVEPHVLPAAGMIVTEMIVMWKQVRRADESGQLPPPRR